MQAGAGEAAAGGFLWIVAPAAADHARRMLVGEMRLNMEHVADFTALDHALQLAHRGIAALVVAAAEHNAGLAARGDRAGGILPGQRQRLLAPDRLFGA